MTTSLLRKILAIASVVSIAICPQPGFAKTVNLAPSSEWIINYAEENCELARAFGEGDDQTVLHITRYVPGDAFRLMLIGEHAKGWRMMGDVKVQFGPGEPPFSAAARPGKSDGKPAAIFLYGMTIGTRLDENGDPAISQNGVDTTNPYKIDPQRERSVREIAFLSGLREEVHLQTGSLAAPFAALRKCNEDLLVHWGIDVEKLSSISKPATPIGSPGNWLNGDDYPPALRLKSGIVNFRLIVEPNGDVSACGIQDTLEPEGFAQATCDLVKRRAKFEPALDADGKPIKSYWASTVIWEWRL